MFVPLIITVIVVGLLSLLASWALTMPLARELVRVNIVGRDVHKRGKPVLAEMGGLSILAGLVVGFSVAIGIFNTDPRVVPLLAAFAAILIVAIVGIIDDIFQLPQIVKACLPAIAALPLVAIRGGVSAVSLPFIGPVDFGLLYPLLLLPIGITGITNATNILAGLNGLEAGIGIVMHGTVLGISLAILPSHPAAVYSAIISAAMLGALIGFIRFNWYPARTFPGDVGTLLIGGALGAAVILGNMEKVGLILAAPYFLEFGLKAMTRLKGRCFGKLRRDGTLEAPKRAESITHLVMKAGRFREWQVSAIIIGIEVLFAAAAAVSVFTGLF